MQQDGLREGRFYFYERCLLGARMTLSHSISAVALTSLLIASQSATAVTITFDEFSAGNNNIAITSLYTPVGVTFGANNSGIWSGISQGDPGNWDLHGTNGTAFLGNNGINNSGSYVTSIFFSAPISAVSFDASRSNGSSPEQTLTASAFQGDTLLSSQSILHGSVNIWTSIAFGIDGITSLIITGSARGFSPFGIDNLQFTEWDNPVVSGISQLQPEVSAIPEPETYALMVAGLGLLGFAARRRANDLTAA